MEKGSLGSYLDVAQVALYVFWAFFAALIYYLHRENKREGYPLESDRSALVTVQGFPPVPKPKT
ncbi:MAG: photosynthetic reaction center subunit H, partial [Phycisphaerae bacterium]